jgi:hypothetical protein
MLYFALFGNGNVSMEETSVYSDISAQLGLLVGPRIEKYLKEPPSPPYTGVNWVQYRNLLIKSITKSSTGEWKVKKV